MGKAIIWTDQAKADIRGIEQPIALQILKTLGRFVLTGEGATKRRRELPPLLRLRAQNYRVFLLDHGDAIKISACSTARRLSPGPLAILDRHRAGI